MILYPTIDPVALDLGFAQIHWYGLTYLLAFLSAWAVGNYRAKQPNSGWTKDQVSDVLFYGALGVILGGRIGYIFFYNFDKFIENPVIIFRIWEGGMSFHGGMLGVFLGLYLFGRKTGRTFFQVSDFIAVMVPLGLGFGRIGNFINKELWGRPVDSALPWAIDYGDKIARHPSSLYQALTEGVILFLILFIYSRKPRPIMAVSGVFMISYGMLRFITEFFRTPDAHLGFVMFDWMSKGQQLSIPMVIFGLTILIMSYKKQSNLSS
ncbi:MAG: prolipoprotein diacylglyceryl transferase [endosymbiont of Galathealinum brachiosum]|uniref:Phosphatidylglycerol--prolipoprotein diacylglyceryl transferase n=1 Tax=endosymbiont of Galathealinum brachiosum TaxID=2200906 RepID=A0A370DBW7_9GAMM|nr:MAG: prolipoprotein diacylglyceryl transferase [endosymbiont of Galathealinum brachiosum]